MKIAITTSSFGEYSEKPISLLKEKGITIVCNPYGRQITAEEAGELLHGCSAVIAGTEPLTAAVLAGLPELKVISRCGAGTDNVDIKAASLQGITVMNTPDAPTKAVAELTLGLCLNMLRQISSMDKDMRSGVWKKRMGSLLSGKRVGIVGFGRIGRAVADIFTAMGCKIAFFDPIAQSGFNIDFQPMDKETLLSWADIITLHCPKPQNGTFVLGRDDLLGMKPGSWVINAARGGVIEEEALAEMLKNGHLAGAAIDVFEKEPYNGPLLDIPTVLVTPHVGSYAKEARIMMEIEAVQNALRALGASS